MRRPFHRFPSSPCLLAMVALSVAAPAATCTLWEPAPGGDLPLGEAFLGYSADEPGGAPYGLTFQFSTDGGATWLLMTPRVGANPDTGLTGPIAFQDFDWDAAADGIAAVGSQVVDVRVVADGPGGQSICPATGVTVYDPNPTCALTAPPTGSTVRGDVAVTFDAAGLYPEFNDHSFAFSLDAGSTWTACTTAAASALTNPWRSYPPVSAATYVWDSVADGVGLGGPQPVRIQILVEPVETSFAGDCTVDVLVDNRPITCTLQAPAAGALLAGEVTVTYDGIQIASLPVTSIFEWSRNGGATWAPATPAATSLVANPDPLRATPFVGVDFLWDTAADGVGTGGSEPVELRIRIDDGTLQSSCESNGLSVNNQPTCSILAPVAGARAGLTVDVIYDASDPSDDLVDITIELSLDGGATWQPATPAAGSPTQNPEIGRPTPLAGAVFRWDTAADLGPVPPPGAALLRLTLDDGAAAGTCQVETPFGCLDCGDCNRSLDGVVDVLDALEAARIDVGLVTADAWHLACCDVNASGGVNILDALLIAQETVMLPVSLLCL